MTTPYRGWRISFDYGEFSAIGPNYDCSWEGPEDGWVSNGEQLFDRSLASLHQQIDEFEAERATNE